MRSNARLALFALLLLAPGANAHVEFLPGEGASLAEAIWLGPKPPAVEYRDLPQHGGIRYYSIDLEANQTVRIRLSRAPDSFATGIPPSLAILGPNLTARGFSPSFLEKPEGANAQVWQGVQNETIEYNPIEGVARSTLVDVELTPATSARYYFAIFDEDDGGNFALHVGERPLVSARSLFFTPREASELRTWEGQNFAHASLPTVLGTIGGGALALALTRGRPKGALSTLSLFALGAAVLFGASASSYAHQAIHHRSLGLPTILPTAGLAVANALVAGGLVIIALRSPKTPAPRTRIAVLSFGLVGFLAWGGFGWGPLAALAAALLPEEKPPEREPTTSSRHRR